MKETIHILHVINTFSEQEMEELKTNYAYLKARGKSVKVSLLYIHPHLPNNYFYIPSTSNVAEEYDKKAKKALNQNGVYFDIDKEDHWIASGNIKSQTMRLASKIKVDMILVSKALCKTINQPTLLHKQVTIPITTVSRMDVAV